tara:strand:- start:19479 stop:20372 length:894 start_codon:yes stop_codon:yes gene_type:complete
MTHIKKYDLSKFNAIKDTFNIPEMNITSIKIINKISSKVGAPSYRKTPVFRKKKIDPNFPNSTFVKTTFIETVDENEINQDKIRELLNKLTNSNYDIISDEIITNLQHFIYTQNDMILMDFGKAIFLVSSINKFWVKLYAKLFNKLIITFPQMNEICINEFKCLLKIFDNIEIGHEDQYDDFCRINKDNEKRRSLLSFYTELYKYDILGNIEIQVLVEKLFKLFETNTDKKIIEEIFENIAIMLKELGSELLESSIGDMITENLIKIYTSLKGQKNNKKIIFKLLDMFEELDIEDFE